MHFSNLARYSGFIGIVVIWVGISFGMYKIGLGILDVRPISYLGVDPNSAKLFSFTLIISAVFFMIFGLYVRRTFKSNQQFILHFLIGHTGQIIAAISPYGNQQPAKIIHTLAAFMLAFSLPLFIREFARSQTNSRYYHLYVRLFRFELFAIALGMGLFVFTRGIAPLGQSLPAIGFHIWVIALTIISLKDRSTN